jgi:hypothetical protein
MTYAIPRLKPSLLQPFPIWAVTQPCQNGPISPTKLQVAENKPTISLALSANVAYTLHVKRKTYQAKDVVEMLKKKQGERSLRQFATDMGISAAYLSDIYKGNRRPGKVVLQNLGLTARIETVEPVYIPAP